MSCIRYLTNQLYLIWETCNFGIQVMSECSAVPSLFSISLSLSFWLQAISVLLFYLRMLLTSYKHFGGRYFAFQFVAESLAYKHTHTFRHT